MAENLHAHHRSRLKARFLKEGLENFEKHNILELLLFFGIPYMDTNEIAHVLLDRFGSISGVCDAPYSELITVKGIKENSATLLKLIPELARVYCEEKYNVDPLKFSYGMLGEYFVAKFLGINKEHVLAAFFDNDLNLITIETIYEGDVNSSLLPMRKLAQLVISTNASAVVLAHNHLSGVHIASNDDMETTGRVLDFLNEMRVTLLDHFIVAKDHYGSIMPDNYKEKYEKAVALEAESKKRRKKEKSSLR
ncbi:MAG: hypothetical protein E7665_03555 [Ruminococcaceae bacterium]|nr:hypothetical protein [Oscillospiraceae bacterium]